MASLVSSVTFDAVDPMRLAGFWTKALGYRIDGTEEGAVFLVPDGRAPGPDIDIIPVSDAKAVKNRLHLDLRAYDGSTQDEEVERLLALGAVRADVGQGPDVSWVVLADPEGNEFCVLSRSAEDAAAE